MSPEFGNTFSRRRVVCDCSGPTLVKQSFRDECNVNVIMARWEKSGTPPRGNPRKPMYGDFTSAVEFQEALNRVMAAQETFDGLPAGLRRRCGNDPALFVEFCEDPANLPELRRLGLAPEEPKPPAGALPEVGVEPPSEDENSSAT